MGATLLWFAAGLEIGGAFGEVGHPDVEHGVVTELDVAVTPHLAARGFWRLQGFGHGDAVEGSVTDFAVGARLDLFDTTHSTRPFVALVLGDSLTFVRPKSAPETSFNSFAALASGGVDFALLSHFGLRLEARAKFSSGGPCCESPGATDLSGSFLLFLGF
jgi:hypothetical protein